MKYFEIMVFGMAAPDADGGQTLAQSLDLHHPISTYDVCVFKVDEDEGIKDPVLEFDDKTEEQASFIADMLEVKYPETYAEWV